MAVLTTGNSYSTGDQVTAANQNAQVNSATFASGAVDDVTTQLSSGAIIVKSIGTSNIDDSAVTPIKTSFFDSTTVATTSGHILVANGTKFFNKAMSGDITIDDTGATTIGAGVVEASMLASGVDVVTGYIHLQDRKAAGTDGQLAGDTNWNQLELTTELIDTGSNCTLSSNTFTLDAGTYRIKARANGIAAACRTRLYNNTDAQIQPDINANDMYGTNSCVGGSNGTASAAAFVGYSVISGEFTLDSTDSLQIDIKFAATSNSAGTGLATDDGTSPEIYSEVELWKIG